MIVDQSTPPPDDPSHVARRGGVVASGPWRAVMAFCRVVVPGTFILLALVGAIVTPPVAMFVVAPLIGMVTGLMVALLNPAFPGKRWARRGALLAAATGTAFVPFTGGLALTGKAGGYLAVALLVLGACLVADRLVDVLDPSPPGRDLWNDEWLRDVMPTLPTAALLQEWRATQEVCSGRRDIAEQTRAVHVRGVILDELARRDPATVERLLDMR